MRWHVTCLYDVGCHYVTGLRRQRRGGRRACVCVCVCSEAASRSVVVRYQRHRATTRHQSHTRTHTHTHTHQWWANLKSNLKSRNNKKALANIFQFYWFRPMVTIGISIFVVARFHVHWSRRSKPLPDNNRERIIAGTSVMGKTKHLKIRSDWVVSNENEYSVSTMTSRFLFKSRVSWIESLKFESNKYQIAWYLNRIAQCLNRIVVAIQIAIESNHYLISPITDAD